MARVTFFCACGLRALLGAQRLIAAIGGQLLLRAPSPCVRKVLTITRTADLFALDATPPPSTQPEKILDHHRAPNARRRVVGRPARAVAELGGTGWRVVARRGLDRHFRGAGQLR